MKSHHDVLVVGSVALDSIETVTAKRDEILGGSASFIATAAAFFAPVRLTAVVGEDFPEDHVAFLRSRGIDLAGLSRVPGQTFRWKGRYSEDFNHRTTLATHLNVFAGFQPHLPESFRGASLAFLGNIDPRLQLDVLRQARKPLLCAMDTMNYWINDHLPALKEVLGKIDFLLLNDEEARLLSKSSNLLRAARIIQEMGVKHVVVKRGDAGALLFHGEQIFAAPALPLSDVVDPTGAGDAFAGGFMGYLARHLPPVESPEDLADIDNLGMILRRAMIAGSTLASFCCEDFSLDRLRTLNTFEITERFRAFRHLTHFEELSL